MFVPFFYLLLAFAGWISAQFLKYVIASVKTGKWFDSAAIFHSGNMPSVHTSTAVALTVAVGLKDGVESGVFAVTFLLMAIVAYDAMGVRRATGEQGLALRSLLKSKDVPPYLALGHKPFEVLIGALIGLVASMSVAFFTASF